MKVNSLNHAEDRHTLPLGKPSSTPALLKVAVGGVLVFALIPFLYLLIRTFEKPIPDLVELLLRAKTLQVFSTTAGLVLMVVMVNIILGTIIATGLHFVRLPIPNLLVVPLILPLAIPSYVITYTWLALFPALSGILASAFILILTTMPYMFLAVIVALRRIDSGLLEVARSLGLTNVQIFIRVVLPQIRGSISAGALLSGLYVMSDFGAVSLLNVETLTVAIQNIYRSSYDRSAAAFISCLLIVASMFFIFFNEKIKDQKTVLGIKRVIQENNLLIRSTSLRIVVLVAVGIYGLLAVVMPFLVLVSRFFGNPKGLDAESLLKASLATVSVSVMGALIALALAAPLGILISQYAGRLSRLSERIILVGHALPGVVIGLALVSLGSKLGPLYQTTLLLAFAYSLLFLAKAVASISTSLQQVPAPLKEVAATLGKSKARITTSVVFPIALPSIGLGALLVFLTSMKELPATLMLRPTEFDTLATQIWSHTSINEFNEAAPYALILVLIAALPTFLLSQMTGKGNRN